MLLEFTCSNLFSIKDTISFSFLAGSDNTKEDQLIQYDNNRINRISAIYGANGSGKTNIIKAIYTSTDLIKNSLSNQIDQPIKLNTFKAFKDNQPTIFTYQFVRNNVRYAYGFSVLANQIEEEYLYYFPNGRKAKIFERDGECISKGSTFKKFSEASMDALQPNRLFLTCAGNYSKIIEIEEAYRFFKDDLQFMNSLSPTQNSLNKVMRALSQNNQLKEMYLKVFEILNTGILSFEEKYTSSSLDDMENSGLDHDDVLEMISRKNDYIIDYGEFTTELMKEESTGIKKLFILLLPYLTVIQNGGILLCDEIETGLHESIVAKLLEIFIKLSFDNNAQILFTTHDTSLLNIDLFRRDQIWFTELNQSRATDLYSLVEIRNVRKNEDLKIGYISGKYGAIPTLDINFMQKLQDFKKSEDSL